MNSGNIYVTGRMESENDFVKISAMSALEFKSQYTLMMKEFFKFFPFGNSILKYVLLQDTEMSQDITLLIKDNFNNSNFKIKSIELTLHNKLL